MQKLNELISKNYGLIIFSLFLCNILGLISIICSMIQTKDLSGIYGCFYLFFFPEKYNQIVNYLASISIMFIAFALIFLSSLKSSKKMIEKPGKYTSHFILIYLTYTIILCCIHTKQIILFLILLIGLILLTYLVCNPEKHTHLISTLSNNINIVLQKKNTKNFFSFIKKYTVSFLTIIFVIMFFIQISPFVFKEMKIMNEFSDIPEQTILSKTEVVDNWQFEEENDIYNYYKKRDNDQSVNRYIKLNYFENYWQPQSRWALYHHAHFWGPCNELELGRDKSKIFSQYGLFSANIFRNVLNHFGGINIQNYFKIYYSVMYLYFGLMFFLSIKIFNNEKFSLIWLLSLVISINVYSYSFVYLTPGLSPLRHFFDIFVIYSLFQYFKTDKSYYFVLGVLFSLLAIKCNWNMGMFLYLSILPALVYKRFDERNNKNLKAELLTFLVSLPVMFRINMLSINSLDYTKDYFTKGLFGWELSSFWFFLILLSFLIGYIIFLKLSDNKCKIKYIAFFMFLYSQGMFLYFIWGSDSRHLMAIVPILSFTLLCLFRTIYTDSELKAKTKSIILNIIIFSFSVCAIVGFIKYVREYMKFEKIFETHTTYKWNLSKAKFLSTMNPKYFTDSIELLEKYSKNDKGVYMISKYDHFIPFIANRYSNMPYLNLEWYILSDKELNTVIDFIREEKPQILYVDKNIISRDVNLYSPYSELSFQNFERQAHIERLKNLVQIFEAVKDDYEAVDSSYLLTVYRRK